VPVPVLLAFELDVVPVVVVPLAGVSIVVVFPPPDDPEEPFEPQPATTAAARIEAITKATIQTSGRERFLCVMPRDTGVGAGRISDPFTWRERTPCMLRLAGALLVATAGAIHLWLYFDFFRHVHVIGVLFLVNAACGIILGLALAVSGATVVILGAIAYAAGTLGGFFLSVYHGLFGYTEALRGPWQEAAGGVEAAALVLLVPLLLAALVRRGGTRPQRQLAR